MARPLRIGIAGGVHHVAGAGGVWNLVGRAAAVRSADYPFAGGRRAAQAQLAARTE